MRNAIRIAAAALLTTLLLPGTFAQTQPAKPSNDIPKLVENIDVRVINVDVVVTDRKGTVITGLKKDDFEIFENGVPKPISNFYSVEGGKAQAVEGEKVEAPAPPTANPPIIRKDEVPDNLRRRIIFYVDNLTMAPFNRNRVFQSMKEFAKTSLRPGDEAMIATFNRSMKIRTPFTRDAGQIATTLDIIAGESALGTSNTSERKQMEDRIRDTTNYDEAISTARTYAEEVEHDLRQSAESLNGLMTTLAGVEGKKILVLASEGFPMQPGREMFEFIDTQANEKGWRFGGGTMLEGMSFDSSSLIQSIARTANANGITMYTIHAAGLTGGNEMSAENAQPTPVSVSQAIISNTTDSMRLMAEMTGGVASIQTNNFAQAFRNIQRDLDSYYSLGYRASTERVDRQRQLVVRMKNKNYIARARQTFVEKSTFAEMNDKVVANLLYKTKQNDLNILVRTGMPVATDEDLFRVPVEIQIPMDSLTLLPQGESEYVGGFEVYVVVANKDGDMSDVSRKSHQLHVPAADKEKTRGKYYSYSVELLMEKGPNKISIGVVDNISNVAGFAREQVIAQDLR
ncbi:MAG TPA: VWA domain-containing protein [Thermoanaerobaculia bacterium]